MDLDSLDDTLSSRLINFDYVPVDKIAERNIYIENTTEINLSYRVSLMYILNSVDQVYKVSVDETEVEPGGSATVRVVFQPTIPGHCYTDHFVVEDTSGEVYKLTVTGKCFGPRVLLDRKKIEYRICKNVSEGRKEDLRMINRSSVDTTYQWVVPASSQGNFQISTGSCGVIRANEIICTSVDFTGTSIGLYTTELICLILNQEPLFLIAVATVVLPGNPLFNMNDHVFHKNWKRKSRNAHMMENSLNHLTYIPAASVFPKYLDFGTGSPTQVILNISQTLCITNHEQGEGYIQWTPDPNNIFIIDPPVSTIPVSESRMFTVRFRPTKKEGAYSYLLCGDYQFKSYDEHHPEVIRQKHTWFRIPCIGNTRSPCMSWVTDWDCPTEVVMPPTVPGRTTFANFLLANKLDTPMYYKFEPPMGSNYVVMPMCGIVKCRGWQIITVALEPKFTGDYYEAWNILINKHRKVRITFTGNAEVSKVEIISHGYNPATHGLFEFPPTVTGCVNYCTAYLHNMTRMYIHIRIINHVSWLGADNCGIIVIPPKEIIRYQWWFFPKTPNKIYDTTFTCSCICMINERPVGETSEMYIHIMGYSELPNLKMLPRKLNLNDVVVGETATYALTLYNYGTCYFTSSLHYLIDGMGDDFSEDIIEMDSSVNTLRASNYCEVNIKVTPSGAGSRQISIYFSVLYRCENDEINNIQPLKRRPICVVWYDGIYPTMRVKRTISVKSPIILSNHCVWNMTNVEELNKALEDCRPNETLVANIYAPDLCVRDDNVELIFVLGCVYRTPVTWSLRREKICDCEMVEVQIGISTYAMRHTCVHRHLVELTPLSGTVLPDKSDLLHLIFNYSTQGRNTLAYHLTLSNERSILIYLKMNSHLSTKGVLTSLRRSVGNEEYLAVLDCGRVPINNLDPVIRFVWLYNPTNVFTTWRLLRGNVIAPVTALKCLLYFAEVPPCGKLAIPIAFLPSEMIDYEVIFYSSFGFDTVQILVKGQGGLPNCVETRLDVPKYVERSVRGAYRYKVVYLSQEHITVPILPTHSLCRDLIAIINDTDHIVRFIWLPERIANVVNIVMTPCWGVVQPKKTEWITMTVYTLQEPATFTTTVACEILDLTERKIYQQNEMIRKQKIERCNQEFIITEKGQFHPRINDYPPYVMNLVKPQPKYLSLTVSISSKGQRDGCSRLLLKQVLEQVPAYDLSSSELTDGERANKLSDGNNMPMEDIIKIIDGILWDALHSKMFKNQLEYYAKEEIPTYSHLTKMLETDTRSRLCKRVTSGICDAIVNKAAFHIYNLHPKSDHMCIMEAE